VPGQFIYNFFLKRYDFSAHDARFFHLEKKKSGSGD
jgi:hypothetical protein